MLPTDAWAPFITVQKDHIERYTDLFICEADREKICTKGRCSIYSMKGTGRPTTVSLTQRGQFTQYEGSVTYESVAGFVFGGITDKKITINPEETSAQINLSIQYASVKSTMLISANFVFNPPEILFEEIEGSHVSYGKCVIAEWKAVPLVPPPLPAAPPKPRQ